MSTEIKFLRNALSDHLRQHAIRTDGPFTLRSGEVSDYYIDARQTTFDGYGALAVGRAVLAELPVDVEAVGGLTMGADPVAVATAIAAAADGRALKAFSIRKEAKGHGTGGRMVGPVTAGCGVAIVEDTTTTGGAIAEAIDVAIEVGLRVLVAISLVDRSGGVVGDRLASMGITYRPLFTPEDLGL